MSNLVETDYVEKHNSVLSTEHSAQEAMARELYQMGYVPNQKKLRHLATAYTLCVIGLVASALVGALTLLGIL